MTMPVPDPGTLPGNFPQDFLPDRGLLARLLAFAAGGHGGTKEEISAATGIPTGKSTGKVEPMIHYARGMGLITTGRARGRWDLGLTALGEIVFREDRYLSNPVTLWTTHLLICRRADHSTPPRGIADPWFALFAEGAARLGNPFERAAFHAFLTERHGQKGYLRVLAGLIPRSYTEAACFGGIRVLSAAGRDTFLRHPAPLEPSLFPAYAAAMFVTWDGLYPTDRQIDLDRFFADTRLLDVLGCNRTSSEPWVAWMADHGLLQLDRLTGGAVALRLADTWQIIRGLYDESA